eukprot:COSAG06_NODE_13397_length_1261_cov_1.277969_1_plen_130_part_10
MRQYRCLSASPLLSSLAPEVLSRVSAAMQVVDVPAAAAIITIGEPGDAIYFIEHGTAEAEVDGVSVMSYKEGGYFGELALLTDAPRKATVRAGSGGAQVLKLNRADFEENLESELRAMTDDSIGLKRWLA